MGRETKTTQTEEKRFKKIEQSLYYGIYQVRNVAHNKVTVRLFLNLFSSVWVVLVSRPIAYFYHS